MIAINLNDVIKVKLTDVGKELYYHTYELFNTAAGHKVVEPQYPNVDAEGYSKFKFSEFMYIYGQYFSRNISNIIEPREIIFEGDETKQYK